MTSATIQGQSSEAEASTVGNELGPQLMQLLLPLMMGLLFLQAFREFIGQIYFQNLGEMALGPTVLFVFLLLSPAVVIVLKKIRIESLLMVTVIGIILFRFIMPFIQTSSVLYLTCAGLVVALFGMYLPVAVSTRLDGASSSVYSGPALLSTGFTLAIAADLTIRTLGITWDFSVGPYGFLIAPVLCIVTALIAYEAFSLSTARLSSVADLPRTTSKATASVAGLGFGGVMFAVLTFLAYPSVVARWTASSYEIAAISVLLGLIIYGLASVSVVASRVLLRKEVILILNLVALLTALDLAYVLSPLAGILAGVTIVAFMMNLRILWGYLSSGNATLTDHALFHFMGMLIVLLFMLLYVLTLVAGQILPALKGLSPYLILLSFVLAVAPALILSVVRKEVVK